MVWVPFRERLSAKSKVTTVHDLAVHTYSRPVGNKRSPGIHMNRRKAESD